MPFYTSIPFTLTALAHSEPPYPGGSSTPPPLSYSWRQVRGPAQALLVNTRAAQLEVTVSRPGTYHFECAVSDGVITNRAMRPVSVAPFWTAVKSYTAFCPGSGMTLTRSGSASSILSAADADSRALAAAALAANSALRCDPYPGVGGWRIMVPPLPASSSLRLSLCRLVFGSVNKPKRIESVAVLDFTESVPDNLIDLSQYLVPETTYYLWVRVKQGSGPSLRSQLVAQVLRLIYATEALNFGRVRFRDVETPYSTYQAYGSAYAISIGDNSSAALVMSLDLGNDFDALGLALHNWDGKAYGLRPEKNYDRLVFSILTGSPASPQRETILDVRSPPGYNLHDPYDFGRNRLSLEPYFYGVSHGAASYVLRRARARADGSLIYDPLDPGLRLEAGQSYDEYNPGLSLPGLKIGPLSANEAGSISPGANIALSFERVPAPGALMSFPVPRFSLSSFKWKAASELYSSVIIVVLAGTPANPTGIGNRYVFAPGDPEVLDGPDNLFLALAEFDTVFPGAYPARFQPFSAVFYGATYDPISQNFTLYPNSFPVLANPRTVHGELTFTVSDFSGYGSYPISEQGAVTFSGIFGYAETLYHARVNGGKPFSL